MVIIMNFEKKDKKLGQKYAIIFNSCNQMITMTITGDIMVLFLTDILRFSVTDITFVMSIIPLVALIRLPLLFAFKKTDKTKMIMMSIFIKMLVVIALLLTPWDGNDFSVFALLILMYQVSTEFGVGICWQPLLREITDNEDRGSFFAKMRFVFMLITSIYTFSVSVFITDKIQGHQYRILLLLVFLGLLLQLYGLFKLRSTETVKKLKFSLYEKRGKQDSIIEQLRMNKNIVWIFILEIVFTFMGLTLMVVYLSTVMNFPSNLLSMYIALNTASATIVLLVLGRIFDKYVFKIIKSINIFYFVYLVAFLTFFPYAQGRRAALTLLGLALLTGGITSCVNLLLTVLQHRLIRDSRHSFMILNLYQILIYVSSFGIINFLGHIISSADMFVFFVADLIYLDLYKIIISVVILLGMICNVVVNYRLRKAVIMSPPVNDTLPNVNHC